MSDLKKYVTLFLLLGFVIHLPFMLVFIALLKAGTDGGWVYSILCGVVLGWIFSNFIWLVLNTISPKFFRKIFKQIKKMGVRDE